MSKRWHTSFGPPPTVTFTYWSSVKKTTAFHTLANRSIESSVTGKWLWKTHCRCLTVLCLWTGQSVDCQVESAKVVKSTGASQCQCCASDVQLSRRVEDVCIHRGSVSVI